MKVAVLSIALPSYPSMGGFLGRCRGEKQNDSRNIGLNVPGTLLAVRERFLMVCEGSQRLLLSKMFVTQSLFLEGVSIMRRYEMFSLVLMVTLAITARDATATTIYYDSFSGSSVSNLDGQSPGVRPSNETWTAAAAWKGDGTITDLSGEEAAADGWLPFAPAADNVYELLLSMSVTANPNDAWLAVGFSSLASPATDHTFYNNVYGWGLKKGPNSLGAEANAFHTASNALVDLVKYGSLAGAMTYDVVLDTRPVSWTVEWFLGGNSIRGPVAIGNPSIQSVGFGAYGFGVTGSVDDFTLRNITIPEPSVLALLSSGLMGLACYAWRRRR